jgi:hypothetical protein
MSERIECCDVVLKVSLEDKQLNFRVRGTQEEIAALVDMSDREGFRLLALEVWSPKLKLWAEHYVAVDQIALVGPTRLQTVQGDE